MFIAGRICFLKFSTADAVRMIRRFQKRLAAESVISVLKDLKDFFAGKGLKDLVEVTVKPIESLPNYDEFVEKIGTGLEYGFYRTRTDISKLHEYCRNNPDLPNDDVADAINAQSNHVPDSGTTPALGKKREKIKKPLEAVTSSGNV